MGDLLDTVRTTGPEFHDETFPSVSSFNASALKVGKVERGAGPNRPSRSGPAAAVFTAMPGPHDDDGVPPLVCSSVIIQFARLTDRSGSGAGILRVGLLLVLSPATLPWQGSGRQTLPAPTPSSTCDLPLAHRAPRRPTEFFGGTSLSGSGPFSIRLSMGPRTDASVRLLIETGRPLQPVRHPRLASRVVVLSPDPAPHRRAVAIALAGVSPRSRLPVTTSSPDLSSGWSPCFSRPHWSVQTPSGRRRLVG